MALPYVAPALRTRPEAACDQAEQDERLIRRVGQGRRGQGWVGIGEAGWQGGVAGRVVRGGEVW